MENRRKDILRILLKTVVCLLILAAAAVPAVFMNSIYGYLPVIMLMIAVLISWGARLYVRSRIRIEGTFGDLSCVRGTDVQVGLTITNGSRLFCPRGIAWIYVSDLFGGTDSLQRVDFTLSPGETVDFGVAMDFSHLGMYSLGLDQVELFDLFGVTVTRIPVPGRFSAFVTPRIRTMDELDILDDATAESPQETRITVVGGTDYTGVREYELGDPMKQIHWKLSAHTRDYVTKLQESNRQREYAVILDFAAEPGLDREQLMDINDCLIETALSLIEEISHHDIGYTLLFCGREGQIVRTVPKGRDDDLELMRSFSVITPDPSGEYPDAAAIMAQESSAANRAANIAIVTSRTTPELVEQAQKMRRQRRYPELYRIVHSSLNSREIETVQAPLRPLEESGVPYFIISTDVNDAAEIEEEADE